MQLDRHRLSALRDHPPLLVTCLRGALWITQVGQPEDHVLEAGQSLRLPANAHTVLRALAPSQVEVQREAPGPLRALQSLAS